MMKWIMMGIGFITFGLLLPFDTLFIDFTQFTAGQLSILEVVSILSGVGMVIKGVFS